MSHDQEQEQFNLDDFPSAHTTRNNMRFVLSPEDSERLRLILCKIEEARDNNEYRVQISGETSNGVLDFLVRKGYLATCMQIGYDANYTTYISWKGSL